MKTASKNGRLDSIEPVTNDAREDILSRAPYRVEIEITGDCPIIFHRFSVEAVEEKAASGKNTKARKTDNVESYVYRDSEGRICVPGEYLKQAIVEAGRYRQDPRSPRKSARDLFKAIVIPLTELAPINGGSEKWDYLDQRRVVVQRSAVVRRRPAFHTGWKATISLQIQAPEYLSEKDLRGALTDAGRLVGLADHRPTYGRFSVTMFKVI